MCPCSPFFNSTHSLMRRTSQNGFLGNGWGNLPLNYLRANLGQIQAKNTIYDCEVNGMDIIQSIKDFLPTDFKSGVDSELLDNLCGGTWDYVQNYTNWKEGVTVPQGLIMVCADMVKFYTTTNPTFEEMQTDDMHIVFNTTMPNSVLNRLTAYRRLRW